MERVKFMLVECVVNSQAETPGSESECNLMDYGLFDLHTGLPQRTYSRAGEAKVNLYTIAFDVCFNNFYIIYFI